MKSYCVQLHYQLGEHQVPEQGDHHHLHRHQHLGDKPHDHWDIRPITSTCRIVVTKNVQFKYINDMKPLPPLFNFPAKVTTVKPYSAKPWRWAIIC